MSTTDDTNAARRGSESNDLLGVGIAPATWYDEGAQITKRGALSCQACIPKHWTDEQAKSFADRENLCGTTNGWFLRKQGDPALAGCDKLVQCAERAGFVHVMFDA